MSIEQSPIRIRASIFNRTLPSFISDWHEDMIKEKFEKEFLIRFNGTGWYLTNTDALLVLPTLHELVFSVHVWNIGGDQVIKDLKEIARMRVRKVEPIGEGDYNG